MTVNFTDREMAVLDELAAAKELSREGVLRQALRLYQMVDVRLSRGERMWPDESRKSLRLGDIEELPLTVHW